MAIVGIILAVLGFILVFVGYIWLVVVAFRVGGIGWGIGSLVTGLVGLIFSITHWEDAKRPFLTEIAGIVVLTIGYILIFAGAATTTVNTAAPLY